MSVYNAQFLTFWLHPEKLILLCEGRIGSQAASLCKITLSEFFSPNNDLLCSLNCKLVCYHKLN